MAEWVWFQGGGKWELPLNNLWVARIGKASIFSWYGIFGKARIEQCHDMERYKYNMHFMLLYVSPWLGNIGLFRIIELYEALALYQNGDFLTKLLYNELCSQEFIFVCNYMRHLNFISQCCHIRKKNEQISMWIIICFLVFD